MINFPCKNEAQRVSNTLSQKQVWIKPTQHFTIFDSEHDIHVVGDSKLTEHHKELIKPIQAGVTF